MTTKEDIADKLTESEYEWFATVNWQEGISAGRKQMFDTILAFLKLRAGELYSNDIDDDADFIRELRKSIMKEIKV